MRVKPEYLLAKEVAYYLRLQYPDVLFRFDLNGNNLSKTQAGMNKAIQKRKGFPVWYFRNLLEKKKVTQGQIKKYIGNSVEVNQARAIIGAIRMTFMDILKMSA